MAYLDPQEAYENTKNRIVDAVTKQFPIQGKLQSLHLDKIDVDDKLHVDDIRSQHQAKVGETTWATPVYAHLTLKDNLSGKVIDQRRIRIAEVPKMTKRYSYIVDGQEYQVDNQWQLRPGVYARRTNSGELEAQFNTGRTSFKTFFDPASKEFYMEYNKANIPIYPIMKTMGVDDDTLERAWGKEVLAANKKARNVATAIERFYKTDTRGTPASKEAAEQHLRDVMFQSKLRPEVTAMTLGKPLDHVNGDTFLRATQKLLRVQQGHPEDDRDSLLFKDLRTFGDFAHDKLMGAARTIRNKADRKINTATDIRDVVKFDLFNQPIKEVFGTSLGRTATQINPVEMVSSSMQTTITGPGGIQSEQAITDEAKLINPSHFGYLDPINTPEGSKTGVTLRIPLGVKKIGNQPAIPLHNLITGKTELVTPDKFLNANVVLPDQVTWDKGKPVPVADKVKMVGQKNEIHNGRWDDAHYVMRHPSQVFNLTSNLIPFLGNNSGGRAGMASRHIEQAISLQNRDAPLVQVSTGVDKPGVRTFEELLGHQASHKSPTDGFVHEIKKDAVVIKDHGGDTHEVQIYHHYPLNDVKGTLHSTPVVKVGDKISAGQVVADTNFSRNGVLALGANLRVGYMPYKGYNFEDGVVISDSAAKKLTSVHLHKHEAKIDDQTILNPKKFDIQHPGMFNKEQFAKLDEHGVIRVGQKVGPGDPLVVAMKPFELKDRTGLSAIRRSLTGGHTDKSIHWESDFEGEVVSVHKGTDKIQVHVRTAEPMQVGDKLAGRYGNKGIVTAILPDKEMPHTKAGEHIEVALNPTGIGGRMNIGQVLETVAGKIAQKTGTPYIVNNFDPKVPDYLEKVKADLKKHGLTDTEELLDPTTGKSLGQVLTGPKHMIKLVHQVEKKLSVRSGMGLPGIPSQEHYDLNLQPAAGGHHGGQTIGALGMYALLAHGAKANIQEMQTLKSEGSDPQTNPAKAWPSQHGDVWKAIQTGAPYPTPKSTFAFKKFTDMLKATGVNVEKKGHDFVLSPLTDKHILDMSAGELTAAGKIVRSKVDPTTGLPKPQPGGLFDEKITGGHGGNKWSHIKLAEPLPNPMFEGPIRSLTGLTQNEFDSIVHGDKGVSTSGKIVDAKQGVTGGGGIKMLLDRIKVDTALPQALKDLKSAPSLKVDNALKKVKYLQALKQIKAEPSDAYILNHLPILPPVIRPLTIMQDGNIKYEDVNGLYSQFAQINDKLKDPVLRRNLTDEKKKDLRVDYYDGVQSIMGAGVPYDHRKEKGLLHQISGSQPKEGFFQNVLVNRRQDLTMRSTIVPEPNLGLDELGLPRHAALTLFRPFLVKKLVEIGAAPTPLEAQKVLAGAHKGKDNPMVWKALDKVMEERPVLLKRDPALHKYSVQAFKSRPVEGDAIKIHPLVTSGYNADFDGDAMAAYVPVTHAAVMEARKMHPSSNLFSEASGKVMYQPTLESALGVYKLSLTGKETSHKFKDIHEAADALHEGKVQHTDLVEIGGQKSTPGRALIAATLPKDMQGKILHDLSFKIDTKGLNTVLTDLAKEHRHEYGDAVNKLKDVGNWASFGVVRNPTNTKWLSVGGAHTLALNDFNTDKATRDPILKETTAKVEALQDLKLTSSERDRRTIALWKDADAKIKEQHLEKIKNAPNNLATMLNAGIKPSWAQYKQMTLAPMLLSDSRNQLIPTPVTKSYSEGIDLGGYWTQMHGARRGAVMKVQEVQEPGYMSKLLQNTTMNLIIDGHDCGTHKGIAMPVTEKDVHDRYLAQDFKSGNVHVPAGTLLTPDVVGEIRAVDKNAQVLVRSPLKCALPKGLCQKCSGTSPNGVPYQMGTNMGVMGSHTIGERAVQLTLKEFHTGGVAGGGSKMLNKFQRFQQLTMLPKKVPDEASLAMTSGKIEKITNDNTGSNIWINGKAHFVGKDAIGQRLDIPLPGATGDWAPPKVGMHIDAGYSLSDPARSTINPHHLYAATGSIEKVQNHLTNEIFDIYKDEGILRKHVETVVKAMSNLTKVVDPGDHEHVLRGEFHPTSLVKHLNETVLKGKKPILHKPVLKGLDMLPLDLHEDWMAKLQHQRLKETIMDAAAEGGHSSVHGTHPIPGIVFGAQFGMTSKDSKRPGMEHLKDVPEHHY